MAVPERHDSRDNGSAGRLGFTNSAISMPRQPRLIIPDVPLHITQRGVDRCPTFITNDDFALYLWALREASTYARCTVHAYVLMTNHIHLLLTPADPMSAATLMRSLGRRYVRYFNDRYRRTGTLWEGRYRSTTVDTHEYFFACSRYIERNPQRAELVQDPGGYAWSSFHHNAGGIADPIITPHPLYVALGADRIARCAAYRQLFAEEIGAAVIPSVRTAPLVRRTMPATSYQEAVASLRGGVVGNALENRERNMLSGRSRANGDGREVRSHLQSETHELTDRMREPAP
jgi:REP-associated tyrosine transposase